MSASHRTNYSQQGLLLLALLSALGPLSIDMYLPALPVMAADLSSSTAMIANTVPAYFLGLALGQCIYGPLSDRIGRKKPLYIGLTIYIFASILCVLAESAWQLIFARVLQALGGCVGVVIARAVIRDRFNVEDSAQAFAHMMMVVTIAPIMAPALGTMLLHYFPWQALFVLLTAIGVLSLVWVHRGFRESLAPERRLHLSWGQVGRLYLTVIKDRSFLWPMLMGACSSGVMFCYISASAEILMDGYALSQRDFALVFGANAVGILLFSHLNKYLSKYYSALTRLQLGSAVQSLGISILLILSIWGDAAVSAVLCGLFFATAGLGLVGPNAMAIAMAKQAERAGTASALMGSLQFFCGLCSGLLLNFMPWYGLANMTVLMLGLMLVVWFSTVQYRRLV